MLLLNSGPAFPPLPALPPALGTHQDTDNDGNNWIINQGALQSICSLVPAHEPWVDPDTGERPTPSAASLAASIVSGAL